ncbi:MAG: aconitate hydratase [Planctomycetes bacterium]|nr:aconitate hydratase [Planctomycetota bacterium]
MRHPDFITLASGKRILFLTKDPELIRAQLAGKLNLKMRDVRVEDLLDDINTDVMTPAWVCFRYRPQDIALDAYAGLLDEKGERVFGTRALMDGNFEAIVSGHRKGTGSSRETAVQCEKWCGIRIVIAASFAPIHERNNIQQGQLMAGHAILERLQNGERVPVGEFLKPYDPISQIVLREGGLFPFTKALAAGKIQLPKINNSARPMTMAEKVLVNHLLPGQLADAGAKACLKPGDSVLVGVDSGYSHEFTTAQVHYFLGQEYGADYKLKNPGNFAVFEDHLLYADGVAKMMKFAAQIQTLRDLQKEFQRHTGCRDYSAVGGISPGICHQVAREQFVNPGDFVQATDSHTCMGGGSNALSWGVGATEYAGLAHAGHTFVRVPGSIRFELFGKLRPNVMAKDVILHILDKYARNEDTLDRVMEFGGPGLLNLTMDERATLTNMATECSAAGGVCEADERTFEWIANMRKLSPAQIEPMKRRAVRPDADAHYDGGVHRIELDAIEPRVAEPGDPTYGKLISQLPDTKIDIAYGGSCTAGKFDDIDAYATVIADAERAGRRLAPGVHFYIQYGSETVERYAKEKGYTQMFERMGVKLIHPGCGACIGCGPGVSETREQVTVSAINRNFQGRSGPGKLYLASPMSVAASAVKGRISEYREGMFR